MNVSLVIGASGLVGGHLMRVITTRGEPVVGTHSGESLDGFESLDIRSAPAVETLVKRVRPQIVYLPAALTNVDHCELHPEESYAVNVLGVRNVTQAAQEIGSKVVFFSSDYIFDGTSGPYREDDAPRPLSVYGQHKVLGENVVSQLASHALIIRTTVVYGTERAGKNFMYRLWRTLRAGKPLRVPIDQIGSPTYAPNMTAVVRELVQRGASGVFHVAGSAVVDRYLFAREAVAAFGLDSALLEPVKTEELGQPARRPLRAGLRIDKVRAAVSTPLLDYREGLRAMQKEVAQWNVLA